MGSCRDILLVCLTGLAEMHVDVDEAGAGNEIGAVDDLGFLFVRSRELFDDDAVLHEDVTYGISLVGGIDHTGVFNPETGHGFLNTMGSLEP